MDVYLRKKNQMGRLFTDEQLDELAEHLAPKLAPQLAPLVRAELEKHFYTAVGKSVVEKFFYFVGIIAIGVLSWLDYKGFIKW